MKKHLLLLLALLFSAPAIAFPHGGGIAPTAIAGVGIGSPGTPGTIYQNYSLAGGDNFDALLPSDIVQTTAPLAPYFSTKVYSAGARTGATGGLSSQYDSDPYFTGAQDSNRGVPVGIGAISQSSNGLALQCRAATGGETPYISTRTLISSMVHTGGYLHFSPPAIIEAYIKYPTNPLASGWHPTFWINNGSPLSNVTSLEFDEEANTLSGSRPTTIEHNVNIHGIVTGWSAQGGNHGSVAIFDNQYHVQSMVLGTSDVKFYLDGVLKSTVVGDPSAVGVPYYALFTSHIVTPITPSDWPTLGATGVTQQVAWYRVWIPTANYPAQVIKPKVQLPTLQVDYNTSMTYNFPTATTIWGAGVSDYCQAIKNSDFEPGSTGEGLGYYVQFPTGLTLAGRQLTGITSDLQPGRIHTSCVPNVAGGSAEYAARGYIDVGPVVNTNNLTATHGVSYSYDVYPDANVGTLLPKVLSVTGLPSGLIFTPATGFITGTPVSAGVSTLTIGVTNSSGQVATKNVTLTVS